MYIRANLVERRDDRWRGVVYIERVGGNTTLTVSLGAHH